MKEREKNDSVFTSVVEEVKSALKEGKNHLIIADLIERLKNAYSTNRLIIERSALEGVPTPRQRFLDEEAMNDLVEELRKRGIAF